VLHPTASEKDIRHPKEKVIQFNKNLPSRYEEGEGQLVEDEPTQSSTPLSTVAGLDFTSSAAIDLNFTFSTVTDLDSDESDLTSLASSEGKEDLHSLLHRFQKQKHTVDALAAEMQSLGVGAEVKEDLERPGVEKKEKIDGFERSGVTHLVHAWYERGRSGPNASILLIKTQAALTNEIASASSLIKHVQGIIRRTCCETLHQGYRQNR
jgi:hypothetical protein